MVGGDRLDRRTLRANLTALVGLRLLDHSRQNNTYASPPLVADRYRLTTDRETSQKLHRWLYTFYKDGGFIPTDEFPESLEEMRPLFEAVHHGAQAGLHQDTLDEVYFRRIRRGGEHYINRKLGAFGADLAALSNFFDTPWEKPAAGLSGADKGWVLGSAGYDLRALGRLKEAAEPIQAGLEAAVSIENWLNAARAAQNLSELYTTAGDLPRAIDYAEQSVRIADQSGDTY